MSLLKKKFFFKGGVKYNRDPNDKKLRLDNIEVFPKRDDVNVHLFDGQDEGAMFNAKKGAQGIGGGDGFYFYDGTHMRKLGGGEGALVTCVAGESIMTTAQRRLLYGMSVLPITAASDVTVGTATTKPALPDGYPGQELTLVNVSASRTITLSDQDSVAASNLQLLASTIAIAPKQCLRLVFTEALGDWAQVGPVVDA
jgi:hypothetical protein